MLLVSTSSVPDRHCPQSWLPTVHPVHHAFILAGSNGPTSPDGDGGSRAAQLRFELWQRFGSDAGGARSAPSLAGVALVPLSRMAELASAAAPLPTADGAEPGAVLLLVRPAGLPSRLGITYMAVGMVCRHL